MKKRIVYVVLFLLATTLLTSCAATPERSAKKWFDATMNLDGNTVLELTCDAEKENVQMAGLWTSAFALLPQLFGLNMESQGDVSDIKFTTVSNDGNTAYVRVHGVVRAAVLAFAQEYPVDETWRMVYENDKWKWCGQ